MDMTIDELMTLCKEIKNSRDKVDELKKIYQDANAACEELEVKLLGELKKPRDGHPKGLKSFQDGEFKFTCVEKKSITVPKGDDREEFFEYLKEIGHYEALITVDSRALNSWYTQEDKAAKARGEPYAVVPGLALPTSKEILSVRKA
jgi:hypothetical protein